VGLTGVRVALLVTLAIALQACELGQIGSDVGREEFRLSILTLNLRGIHDRWGGQNEEEGATVIPWQDRYERIATWMQDSQTIPDIISLQEVWGHKSCPTFGVVGDYEALFELMSRIQARTNVSYRIAYFSIRGVPQGACSLWAGNAVLYNPDRLANITGGAPTDTVWAHDNTSQVGVHLRRSFPCSNPPQRFASMCALIDGQGLHWASSYHRSGGVWVFGPSLSRFQLVRQPGLSIHIYNVHVDFNDYAAALQAISTLVNASEQRYGDTRLYPPIIAGDFNIGLSDMTVETTEAERTFENFEIVAYAERDVMGILLGDQDAFPSRFSPTKESQVLPTNVATPVEEETYCGPIDRLWSDHCGMFARFFPY
jgi:hypothetical protein